MKQRIQNPRTHALCATLITLMIVATTFLAQGCASSTAAEQLEKQKQDAYSSIMNMYWVRHPDIKDKCFGVYHSYRNTGTVVIDCSYVEHLLVNPTPPELPELETK